MADDISDLIDDDDEPPRAAVSRPTPSPAGVSVTLRLDDGSHLLIDSVDDVLRLTLATGDAIATASLTHAEAHMADEALMLGCRDLRKRGHA